jgi:hypothetical protein
MEHFALANPNHSAPATNRARGILSFHFVRHIQQVIQLAVGGL